MSIRATIAGIGSEVNGPLGMGLFGIKKNVGLPIVFRGKFILVMFPLACAFFINAIPLPVYDRITCGWEQKQRITMIWQKRDDNVGGRGLHVQKYLLSL
jgi:hypothetical protein